MVGVEVHQKKKKETGRQIITVVHSDEATVPDWNINMLEERKGKKGECVCLYVQFAFCVRVC